MKMSMTQDLRNEAKQIREEVLEFAKEEIRPLLPQNDKSADDKAFIITLKLFMIHDIRLQSHHTLDFIAIIMGVTRERIRQIESKAMKMLKHLRFCKSLYEYVSDKSSTYTSDF